MAKREPINHASDNLTEATGINVEGLTERINGSVRQFNDEQPSPSEIVEHLENNFNKRELAIIVGTTYIHQDAFNEVCAEEIFNLYIKAGVKRYETLQCRSPTEQDVVRM